MSSGDEKAEFKGIKISNKAMGMAAGFAFIIITLLSIGFGKKLYTLGFWGGADPAFGDILRNIGWVIAGVLGLILAKQRTDTATRQADISNEQAKVAIDQAKIAMDNLKLSERGQFADRYQKAAAMMGNENRSIREAGIFALVEVAKADPEGHYLPVQKLLCAFIRERSGMAERAPVEETEVKRFEGKTNSDIVEARSNFIELYRSFGKFNNPDWRPDLSDSDLRSANFSGLKLHAFKFTGSDFCEADLTDCSISDTDFDKCDLEYASFNKTNIEECSVRRASFNCTEIVNARIRKTKMFRSTFLAAELGFTIFDSCRFTGVAAENCDLTNTIFVGSPIKRLKLKNCTITTEQARKLPNEVAVNQTIKDANDQLFSDDVPHELKSADDTA